MLDIDVEVCRSLDVILEADFLGRAQSLTLEKAEQRLHMALGRHAAGRRGELRTAINEIERRADDDLYLSSLSYRSVAYDAAGLTATMVRMFADSECKIIDAHLALMRSMIVNAPEPDVQPLFEVLDELKG
jgi:hypothetical protein